MFSSNNSPFSGLVPVILVLVLIGAIAALALSGSDLTNFMGNRAEAQALVQQNKLDAEKAAVDLENYQALQASQVQAQIDKANAESTAYQRSLEQQILNQQAEAEQNLKLEAQKAALAMENARFFRITLGIGIVVLAVLVGLGLCIYFVRMGRNQQLKMKLASKISDPFDDLVLRKKIIAISREMARVKHSLSESESPIPVEIPARWEDLREKLYQGQNHPNRKELK